MIAGRCSRPVISDPQPVVRGNNPEPPQTTVATGVLQTEIIDNMARSRSPLSTEQRADSLTALDLNRPRVETYRQERTRLAGEGSNLREEV